MILSGENRYLFVQLPRTGCTAVARELVENYGGRKILAKHSPYHEFVASEHASPGIYVFSTVRHPLDDLVSGFEKLRTNHEQYLDPERHVSQPNGYISDATIERFKFVSEGGDFDEYVRRYVRLPVDDWSSLAHKKFNRVMRFESLSDDFAAALNDLGLEQVRELPVRNTTSKTRRSWESYFDSPSLQRFVSPRVFPLMRRWNYDFPSGWESGKSTSLWAGEAAFLSLQIHRRRVWRQPAPAFEDGK